MSKSKLNKTEQLNKLLKTYLETKNKLKPNQYGELEIKFGTRGIKKITKNVFDNVIQQLKGRNFKLKEEESYYLNIKTDIVRTSIHGLKNIQEYCRTNNISSNYPKEAIKFDEKSVFVKEGVDGIINYDDFNFRIAYSLETNISQDSEIVLDLLKKWGGKEKFYRLINRYTMTHEDYPLVIDLSIVRESRKGQNNLKESSLFNLPEKYEIEIELNNKMIDKEVTPELLDKLIKKTTKLILSGLQGTNYPVSYSEQNDILENYMKLVHGDTYSKTEIRVKDFIGPSSATLQLGNIIPENKNSNIINIRKNYTVTDKADGDRKMLYISTTGKIYLITTLMEVEFTGAQTNDSGLYNSLIDGEHIKHNKHGEFINLYAAFDIYYINKKDIRDLLFTPEASDDISTKFRLPLLDNLIKNLKAVSVLANTIAPINIQKKTFYQTSAVQTIFQICNVLETKILTDQFVYETDGFIFTPSNLGVGVNNPGDKPNNEKYTWNYSLKWKPAKYNTIDFLITTKKMQSGIEYIGNVFEAGLKANALDQIVQYKTIILRVGYDSRKHGYITNPCEHILKDTLPQSESRDDEESYKPVQFFPSNPPDSEAGITNIELKLDGTNNKQMFTENNEIIEDNTIVECRYDMTKDEHWRWIPLRVRYDKTAELRRTNKQFGNAYHVAESNWHSIHVPVTIEMLTTGLDIPNEIEDDIYYNSKKNFRKDSYTRSLRDFHNLFVKKMLILSIANPGDTLIDYAVGKGGDLAKWTEAELSFVFGIDLSKDNIQNKIDGVCARYLTEKKKNKIIPAALFLQGNASENIKNGSALYTEKGKLITKAVFGEGPKDEKFLEKGVINAYGKGLDGFNISSIQFAMHYMFENANTLHNFLTNVAECTKLEGYFIGTSYDGKEIFDLLKDKPKGGSETFWDREEKNKLLEITKLYSGDNFEDNISCLGYGIDVFQESINKTFTEYLVNYDYLISVIQNYGFAPLTTDEAKAIGLNSSIGSFRELFALMDTEIKKSKDSEKVKQKYKTAYKMTKQQKSISFLNKYFIFKKIRNVDINDIKIGLVQPSDQEQVKLEKETLLAKEIVKSVTELNKQTKSKIVKKLPTKIKLVPT